MALDDISRLTKKVKSDERYKRIRKLYKTNPLFQLTVDEYRTECQQMFRMRKIRTLNIDHPNALNKLANSVIEDQAYRSRMTEIYVQTNSAIKALADMLERFQDYATVTYSRDLKALGAAKERERMVRNIMAEYYRYSDNLTLLKEEIDFYLKDIDKAGFAFKSLTEILALIERREYGLPNQRK
ncbi:hypothetical protein fHeYen902_062c [Yersinia phage fHe-Yen9-02]|nr:hypothetical protein fHeYen902_062c [Yersinia phage fHe-Yen9-02]